MELMVAQHNLLGVQIMLNHLLVVGQQSQVEKLLEAMVFRIISQMVQHKPIMLVVEVLFQKVQNHKEVEVQVMHIIVLPTQAPLTLVLVEVVELLTIITHLIHLKVMVVMEVLVLSLLQMQHN